MNRRSFVQTCMGACLAIPVISACNKEDDLSPVDIVKINLTTHLLGAGSTLRIKQFLVIRLVDGNLADNFSVLQASCPHAGGDLGWSTAENLVVCPVHGSRFTQTGGLVNGPAAQNLKQYRFEIRGNELWIWPE